jgi:hypothetical protein
MNKAQRHTDRDECGAPFSRVTLIRSATGHPVGWVPAHEGAHAFVDTLHVEIRRAITSLQLMGLNMRCRVAKQMRPNRPNCSKWRRVLHIQNPSREALQWLRGNLGRKGLITRVDISLDLQVACDGSARRLQRFFEQHLVQRWRGRRITFRYETTRYWADSGLSTRNLVVYSDQPSKATGTHCCHVEHRTVTAAACRCRGLGTFEEILHLDFRAFWERELCLKAIDAVKLDRAIERKAKEKLGINPPPMLVQHLIVARGQTRLQALREKIAADVAGQLNVPADELQQVDAQDLKDEAAWLADRCLMMVPNDRFLMMVDAYDSVQD